MRQRVLNYPFFSMQLKTADHKYTNVMDSICIREDATIPPNGRQLIGPYGFTTVGEHYSYWDPSTEQQSYR